MHIPKRVQEAKEIAIKNHFEFSCIDEVGKLLSTLSAAVVNGKVGEIGTGYGVGASWMIDSLHPSSEFFSIDHDIHKIKIVSKLFLDQKNAHFFQGDWTEIEQHGPFQLLFADGGKAKEKGTESLVNLLTVGGIIVLDDLTPEELWPEDWRGKPDPVREFWLNHPGLKATEILVTPSNAVIIATKIKN